uniref:BMA-TRP-4 n=1 Tax=Brugia malayi TaxID=6279 RepID=A0A0H5S549_BRUMA|nr:BMA-TRP-4 [Brugia malayi]
MAMPNDDIISSHLHGGILASALADLQKYDNYNEKIGGNSIPEFRSKSFLINATTNPTKEVIITPQLTSVYNSPLSTYRGIIGTALRNEISTTTENGYIPSQYEQQSFPLTKRLPISLNDPKSMTNSFDHTLSTTNDGSTLQSARIIGQQKGNKRGMISKWLQDITESTPDLSSRKEIADVLISPRTGILGLLLKKKKGKFRDTQTCKSSNSLSSSLDPTVSETNSFTKESRISQKNQSLLSLKRHERSHDKHLSLEDLDCPSVLPSPGSTQSRLSRRDESRKNQKANYKKWSIQQSTSKESKSSSTSTKLLIDEDEYSKNLPSKLLLHAMKCEWSIVEQILNNEENIDLTVTDPLGFTVLFYAVKSCNASIFNKLLNRGALLETITKDGRTIAHIAAMYGNEGIIRQLLNCKIDFKLGDKTFNQTPLHLACKRTSKRGFRVTQLLLKYWEDGRLVEDLQKCLPIHYAVKCGNLETVKLLLEIDRNGDSLLHLACRSGDNDMLQFLSSYNQIDVNIANSNGWTVLHEVALKGSVPSLRILHKLGANANIFDKEDRTPLHIAAAAGRTNIAQLLIEKFGGSVRARTRDGSTLLHVAALSGHASTALTFLKHGVPLCMPNRRGALGLHSAAAAGFTDVVQLLIARGTNVDIKTRDNYTALHVAVQAGKASVVETLLGYGADVHVHGGAIGETALHIAASLTTDDAIECAVMLLKSGAQTNVTRNDGETPLHIAARNPLSGMIRLLLSEGADPKICSNSSESVLHVAAKSCNSEAVTLILEYLSQQMSPEEIKEFINARTIEDGLTAVHYAAQITSDQLHFPGEDAKLIETLIDYNGQPELQTYKEQETAMHLAARSGNEAALLAIVDKIGAGAVQIVQNKQSKNGWSPLMEACALGHFSVAQILLDHHARVDVFDENGRTALHLAAANGHLKLTQLLLTSKAFVNSKSKTGEAPLHLAAQNGHVKVVSVLVEHHGALLEAITLDNQTALHFAARYGQLTVAQTLLALGANPNARDDKGQTPLHLAAENDYPDVVKLFLKMRQNNRAVLTAIDLNGFTCAHIAAVKGSYAVVKELMMIDKAMVIQAKTKTMEATALHMAAAGGHSRIVKILLEHGANAEDENAHGMTALHLGAKNGFVPILNVFDESLWKKCSKKTGLNALHIAAFYGNSDFVMEMLKRVPANLRSEPPIYNHYVVKEFATEYGFTPLHLAAQSGHDSLVRMLLNQGVQVDATSTTMSVIPLHLAAQQGHIAVVGMLLSRSTQQQHAKDWRGRTSLHLAAMNGHYEMVSLLIAQGSNINVMDQVHFKFIGLFSLNELKLFFIIPNLLVLYFEILGLIFVFFFLFLCC